MNSFLKIYKNRILIIVFYPVFLGFILELVFQEYNFSSLPNFFENLLFGLIIFLITLLLSGYKKSTNLITIILLCYSFFLFIETGLYLLFQTRINSAYIYVFLETNFIEAKEFTQVYFEENLIWLVLFILPLVYIFYNQHREVKSLTYKRVIISLTSIVLILALLKSMDLARWNFPYVTLKAFLEYRNQIDDVENYKLNSKNLVVQNTSNNETVVVIIGESTSRGHLGIYKYYRNTTPNLDKLKDSLYFFNDVISSEVYTTAAISDMLLVSNDSIKKNRYSVISFLKQAGYKVYWLSNQRPAGLNDNVVAKLASESDESLFLSYNDFRHKTLYDGVLLPELDKRLKRNEKKVIFLHLIGTHYDYQKRYPLEFEKFKTHKDNKKNSVIDAYDNAVYYNDFIVSEVIKQVSEMSSKSAVIYTSDHGEEVFDGTNYFGHFDTKPTKAMYEVPFVLYLSPDFEVPKDFLVDKNRKYMLDDFSHSLTHLIGVKNENLQESKSVFSSNFQTKKRIIRDSLDFDIIEFK